MTVRWGPKDASAAAEVILRGGLVAFPTETVYGLGGDATSDEAVAAIFEAKGRPSFNPLILHVPDLEAAARLVRLPPPALRLAELFWPGPLTLVAPCRDDAGVSRLARAGLPTAGVRAPAHDAARALLRAVGRPVAGPSANPSGRISPTTADHVLTGLGGRIDGVLDAGPCPVGVESAIVGFADGTATLLREGGIDAEALEDALGAPLRRSTADAGVTAPGQLASHYAPAARLRLNAGAPLPGEAFLGFGAAPGADVNLSPAGDLKEAAARLFAALHQLDAAATRIAVSPIPDMGLGRAINDRLVRAAAPRPGAAPTDDQMQETAR